MAKVYFKNTKGKPKKSKPWVAGRKYKWAFWILFWSNITYFTYTNQDLILKMVELVKRHYNG